jgi:hypothetical protein
MVRAGGVRPLSLFPATIGPGRGGEATVCRLAVWVVCLALFPNPWKIGTYEVPMYCMYVQQEPMRQVTTPLPTIFPDRTSTPRLRLNRSCRIPLDCSRPVVVLYRPVLVPWFPVPSE